MKKYLIIGGAGFIGSHLSEALLKQKNKVVVVDASVFAFPGIKAYKIDVDDAKKIGGVFRKEKPDFVFHLAGAINLRRQITDPLFVNDIDFLSRTKVILDICQKNNIKKVIFVSSGGAIYQDAVSVPTKETYLAHPTSLYGLANLAIEKYLQLHCQNNNLHFVVARLSNAYGSGQWESGFIPAIILKILKKENPILYGTGNQTRDFIYIDDVVEALIVLAKRGDNEIYNVGSSKEISLNTLFELTRELLGAKIKPIYKNSNIQETQRSALDIKKMKKAFGWQPKTDIKEGLLKTIEWYKKNEEN
ncbi:MAG: hypothetical protein A2908_04025 [Candidatus Staskawiczbacteria bacterium RIFCSPLOWO2_01_FULL_38_12b]|uniref:NAD-dependent epimerase/dehydratase domain-containing protein n=1 Tax=Candidatus Staskawiczbacteria bacterium RIFCSPLOWO2_01_FULL_38_12b TaxID=1802214 RepID=A0A1G2IBZ5_9BACT|nr:MAG: hypothetical protein A2908_04025 [Candidatus Staskawiczbacteria bacterium RIFCSPLOWO2_01_FULL_38_12b]